MNVGLEPHVEVDVDINLVFDINFESVLPLAIFLHDANIVKRFNIQQTDKMAISCWK